jgi:hypothetical protein
MRADHPPIPSVATARWAETHWRRNPRSFWRGDIHGADIIPFQLLRGALWTYLGMAIVRMMKAKRWEASLAVALTFAVLLSLPLGLFPNPYMPPLVARSHFFEVSSSMLLFGGIAGWVMYSKEG